MYTKNKTNTNLTHQKTYERGKKKIPIGDNTTHTHTLFLVFFAFPSCMPSKIALTHSVTHYTHISSCRRRRRRRCYRHSFRKVNENKIEREQVPIYLLRSTTVIYTRCLFDVLLCGAGCNLSKFCTSFTCLNANL